MDRISITNSERVLMEVLWQSGPLSPAELMSAVKSVEAWAEPTIKTLLHRLMQCGAVRSERRDTLRYVPLIEREAYIGQQVDDLIDRLFAGNRQALITYLERMR